MSSCSADPVGAAIFLSRLLMEPTSKAFFNALLFWKDY